MDIVVHLQSTRPMIQHNVRLANPLDLITRKLKELTAKRQKTDQDLANIMFLEARGGCYETPDGLLGVPNGAVFSTIQHAAREFKLGKKISQCLRYEDVVTPILLGESTVTCDEYIYQNDGDTIDFRMVSISGKKVTRARPRIPRWSTSITLEFDDRIMDIGTLAPIIDWAGAYVGVGDWRPTYGTFTATVEEVAREHAA